MTGTKSRLLAMKTFTAPHLSSNDAALPGIEEQYEAWRKNRGEGETFAVKDPYWDGTNHNLIVIYIE